MRVQSRSRSGTTAAGPTNGLAISLIDSPTGQSATRPSRLAVLAVLFVALLVTACGAGPGATPAAPAAPAAPVTVAIAQQTTIAQVLTTTGDVKAVSEVSIVPKQPGRIEKMPVDVGTKVQSGDVLAQLDHTTLDLSVRGAQAQFQSAQAKLATVQAGPRPENVRQAELAVATAQSRLQAQLDGPKPATVTQAEAALDSARQRLTTAKAGGRAESIGQAQAALSQAQARLQALKNGLRPEDQATLELVIAQAKNALFAAQVQRDGACNPRNPAYLCQSANASVDAAQTAVDQATSNLKAKTAPPTQTDVQQAQAAVDQAQSAVDLAKRPVTDQDVRQAEDAVRQAEASLALAKQPYTDQDIQQSRNAVDVAQQQLALAKQPFTDQDLQTAKAGVAQAQVTLDQALQAVQDATVTAPVAGVVTQKLLTEGAFASAAAPIVVLASSEVKAQVPVKETDVADLRVGQSAVISGSGLGTATIPGKVTNVAPSGDTKNRSFIAEITPDSPVGMAAGLPGELRPGMFVKVEITLQERRDVVGVPNEAIVRRGEKVYVFAVQDGVARQLPVTLGVAGATQTEIVSGISTGASVIIQGQEGLSDGTKVTATPAS